MYLGRDSCTRSTRPHSYVASVVRCALRIASLPSPIPIRGSSDARGCIPPICGRVESVSEGRLRTEVDDGVGVGEAHSRACARSGAEVEVGGSYQRAGQGGLGIDIGSRLARCCAARAHQWSPGCAVRVYVCAAWGGVGRRVERGGITSVSRAWRISRPHPSILLPPRCVHSQHLRSPAGLTSTCRCIYSITRFDGACRPACFIPAHRVTVCGTVRLLTYPSLARLVFSRVSIR
jgi:hypothetical protein